MRKIIQGSLYLLLLASLFTLTGCMTRPKAYQLSQAKIEVDLNQPGTVVIATQDNRPFVLSGEKPGNYIGRYIKGTGIPVDVLTRNKKTVAQNIGYIIGKAMSSKRYHTKAIEIPQGESLDITNSQISSLSYDRVLLVSITRFKVDSFMSVDVQYGFEASIYDHDGSLIASQTSSDIADSIDMSFLGTISTGKAQRAMLDVTGKVLFEMMNSEEFIAALSITDPQVELVQNSDEDFGLGLAPAQEKINQLQEDLKSSDIANFRLTCRETYRLKVNEEKYLDQIADILWQQRDAEDRKLVDGMCYLCKVVARSRNSRYRTFLENMAEEAQHKKVRKYAANYLNRLRPEMVLQYEPKS